MVPMNMNNILLLTDSYKITHWKQYPPETKYIHSYFESRGGEFNEVVFFGLQYFLHKYLSGVRVTETNIKEAKYILGQHLADPGFFNEDGWRRLMRKHDGRLPVRIKAVPEGTTVPTRNVLMTIENTDPEFPWLTNFLETLLVQVWYPTTVCTQSRQIKKVISQFMEETGCDPTGVPFKLHDFGFRGVSSPESAGIGGLAHLVNFMGTDTLAALLVGAKYYDEDCAGVSIPASEHSTITAWGKDRELEAYRNMLDAYPEGLVACVSDSYDIFKACEDMWGGELRERVMSRNGTLVIRPDSGNPYGTVLKVLSILGERFGYSFNEKGYQVLPDCIRVIQGDGVDFTDINAILSVMKEANWAADNIVFGMGGGLLQKLNRDTQNMAFKCSAAYNDEHGWYDVYKDPVTDPGKVSKKGRLKLVHTPNGFATWPDDDGVFMEPPNELLTVFEDGVVHNVQDLKSIRARAKL